MNRSTLVCFAIGLLAACQGSVDGGAPPVEAPAAYAAFETFSTDTLNGGASYNDEVYSVDLRTYTRSSWALHTFDREAIRGGVSANGPSTDGIETEALSGVALEASLLENVGTPIVATLVDGRTYRMVVRTVVSDDASERRYYEVETSLDDAPWIPLCGLGDDGAPILAMAVPGVFAPRAVEPGDRAGGWRASSHEFNFACRGSSVAKCVEMGFAPHLEKRPTTVGADEDEDEDDDEDEHPNRRGRENRVDDDDRGGRPSTITTPVAQAYHEACVRMLRADYCGDGVSHTEPGVLIRYWDRRGPSPDLGGWTFEAGWTSDGAACLEDTRLGRDDVPSCVSERRAEVCADRALSTSVIGNAF